ncbi:hypothetical protein BC826DRAFT_1104575 [Russula brevipes]|nr:hypothetical protein BC826DRAFT_1104575 [Russula brevipes]
MAWGKTGKLQTGYPQDPDSHSGEDFNFESVNRQELSSESTASPLVSSYASPLPTVASDAPTRATTPSSELLGPPPKISGERTVKDIEYFFRKAVGAKTVCKVCEKQSKESPGSLQVGFLYSPTTSNSMLWKHLNHNHKDEYLCLHKARGWTHQLDSLKTAGTVPTPVSEAQSLVPFSQKSFLEDLRDVIIANDLSINFAESPELHKMVCNLQPALQDKDIPQQTKVRGAIMDKWQDYFYVLKKDLANAPGRISFTADIWSNQTHYPFLAVTVHRALD